MMTRSTFRGGGTSLASIFSNMRSIRIALGFIGARPLARNVCPVASNPVGDLVHAGFECSSFCVSRHARIMPKPLQMRAPT
jgi:hypothetical protein